MSAVIESVPVIEPVAVIELVEIPTPVSTNSTTGVAA